jgi:hypothetical protein
MLDTPTYFASKWTREEFARARAKEIHILRVIWPDHSPTNQTDLAESIYLDRSELSGGDGPIVESVIGQIVLSVESLRSRSIASRFISITGRFRAEVQKIGGNVTGVGAHRAVSVQLPSGNTVWAYPMVGIPTAELLNDVADKARLSEQVGTPILVYDHVGIRDQWMAHLKWLDENIASVRAVQVNLAGWSLADL